MTVLDYTTEPHHDHTAITTMPGEHLATPPPRPPPLLHPHYTRTAYPDHRSRDHNGIELTQQQQSMTPHLLGPQEDYRCVNNNNNSKYHATTAPMELSQTAIHKQSILNSNSNTGSSKLYSSNTQTPPQNGYVELNGNIQDYTNNTNTVQYEHTNEWFEDDQDLEIRPRAASFDNMDQRRYTNGYSDAASKARERFRRRPSTSAMAFGKDMHSAPDYDYHTVSGYHSNVLDRPAWDSSQVGLGPTCDNNTDNTDDQILHSRGASYHGTHTVVHDGYATLTRPRRKSSHMRTSLDSALHANTAHNSLNHSNSQRTVVLPQQPCSSSFDAKMLRLLVEAKQNGYSAHTDHVIHEDSGVVGHPHRPSKLNLAQTMHALPQHDISVHHARSIYLTKKSYSESTEFPPRENKPPPYLNGNDFLSQSTGSSTPDSSTHIESPATTKNNTTKSPLFSIMSSRFGSLRRPKKPALDSSSEEVVPAHAHRMHRSNSTPNIMDDTPVSNSDEDGDNDDYGFLSFRSFRSKENPFKTDSVNDDDSNSTDMPPKSRSTSGGGQDVSGSQPNTPQSSILPKKWRKSKSSLSKEPCAWKPQDHCTWVNPAQGQRVTLTSTQLLQLTDMERLALRKLAHARLQARELGCTIVVPKDHGNKRSKRGFSLKKRNLSASLLDGFKDKAKDAKDGASAGRVFGVPLSKVIANDIQCERRRFLRLRERRGSADLTATRHRNLSTCSVSRDARYRSLVVCNHVTDLAHAHSNGLDLYAQCSAHNHLPHSHAGYVSSDSLSESDSRSTESALLEALSLPSSGGTPCTIQGSADSTSVSTTTSNAEVDARLAPHVPHVPYVMDTCFRHIQTHGVQVQGIFRIGSSKKRVKQLREEFDGGDTVLLSDEHSAHDVGGLLKEFLRDLPDPLLTRDLYAPFLAATKIKDESERREVQRSLIALLPVANRDTLYALLNFLSVIAGHAQDQRDCNGHEIPGNKMDSYNLATLFGPNILHKAKGREFEVESVERLDERGDVIAAVKDLIDHYQELFEISAEQRDELYKAMLETSPHALEILLDRAATALHAGSEHDTEERNSPNNLDTPKAVRGIGTTPMSHINSKTPHSAHSRLHKQSSAPVDVSRKQHYNAPFHDSRDINSVHMKGNEKVVMRNRVFSTVERPTQSMLRELKSNHRKSTPEQPLRYLPIKSASVIPSRKSYSPQNLHIRVSSSESQNSSRSSLLSPQKSPQTPLVMHKPVHTQDRQDGNYLTVPTYRESKERASNSSLSSGYYGSNSRSGTTSPTSPEASQKWYMETPPDSPPPARARTKQPAHPEPSPAPFRRTSSLHRPLNINPNISNSSQSVRSSLASGQCMRTMQGSGLRSPSLPHWHAERWRHWEHDTQQLGMEAQEQVSLV